MTFVSQGRLEDWLHLLRLDEYAESLRRQQVTAVEQMTQLTWEDLEDIGITKLGHQKKVLTLSYFICYTYLHSFTVPMKLVSHHQFIFLVEMNTDKTLLILGNVGHQTCEGHHGWEEIQQLSGWATPVSLWCT